MCACPDDVIFDDAEENIIHGRCESVEAKNVISMHSCKLSMFNNSHYTFNDAYLFASSNTILSTDSLRSDLDPHSSHVHRKLGVASSHSVDNHQTEGRRRIRQRPTQDELCGYPSKPIDHRRFAAADDTVETAVCSDEEATDNVCYNHHNPGNNAYNHNNHDNSFNH